MFKLFYSQIVFILISLTPLFGKNVVSVRTNIAPFIDGVIGPIFVTTATIKNIIFEIILPVLVIAKM